MKALVTGGAGFIGSNLVDALLARGDEVTVVDDLSTGRRENLDGALATARSWSSRTSGTPTRSPRWSARRSRKRSSTSPPRSTCASRSKTPPSTCGQRRRHRQRAGGGPAAGARRVVFVSTGGAIYGDGAGQELPLPEQTPAAPEAPYGQSKYAAEGYLGPLRTALRALRGEPAAGQRLRAAAGPARRGGRDRDLLRAAAAGGRPTVFGDGTQTRDYIYMGDVVAAAIAAAESEATGPINIGTGDRDQRARAGRGCSASSAGAGASSPSSPRRALARCSGARSTQAAPNASWAGAPRPRWKRACG